MHIDERLPELALILLAICLPSTVVLKALQGTNTGPVVLTDMRPQEGARLTYPTRSPKDTRRNRVYLLCLSLATLFSDVRLCAHALALPHNGR